MTTKNYLDYEGLKIYHELIKRYIDEEDAKSIKTMKIDGTVLSFYKIENPTENDVAYKTITIPEQDLSDLLHKIKDGIVDNIVTIGTDGTVKDSGININNVATKVEVNTLDNKIGNLDELNTDTKTNIVSAVNEISTNITDLQNASTISISTEKTTDGYLKSYTIKQNNVTIAVIDIPKDLVVTNGSVVVNPDGQEEGTYIKLLIANQTDPLYINVGKLVDIYKAKEHASQVQIFIDQTTREISATIVAGSITSTELADNSVTTNKITDANVTLAKLALDIQTSLGKADSAIQSIVTGTSNGNISVDGTDVPVKGFDTLFSDVEDLKEKVGDGAEYIAITEEEIDSLFNKNTVN